MNSDLSSIFNAAAETIAPVQAMGAAAGLAAGAFPGMQGIGGIVGAVAPQGLAGALGAPPVTPPASAPRSAVEDVFLKNPAEDMAAGLDPNAQLFDMSRLDYQDPYRGLSPLEAAWAERAGSRNDDRRNADATVAAAAQGKTPERLLKERIDLASAQKAGQIAAATTHLDDAQYNALMAKYNGLQAPQLPSLQTQPQAPTLEQVLLSAVAAYFNRDQAGALLAVPFQAQAANADIQRQQQLQNYQIAQGQYQQERDALSDELRFLSARQNQEAQLTEAGKDRAVRESEIEERTLRGFYDDLGSAKTPTQLQQVFDALDASGHGDLIPEETRRARVAESQKAVENAELEKAKQKDLDRARGYLQAAQMEGVLPEGRANNFDQAVAILQRVEPENPYLPQMIASRDYYRRLSPKQQNEADKTKSTVALNTKKGVEIDARTKALGVKYKIDAKRLATYDVEFREKIASRQAQRRNVESQIAARNLHGSLAVQKAQAKAAGDEGALTKSDVKLLTSESSALAKEASVLRAQRGALVDRFTGEVRRGAESTAADLDKRIAAISTRQGQIGTTFRINREADQRARAAASATMPPTLGGSIPKGGGSRTVTVNGKKIDVQVGP